jgi:hypothetical protein
MRPGLELKIEGIEADMAVEEALVALIKADMAAAEVDAAGEDNTRTHRTLDCQKHSGRMPESLCTLWNHLLAGDTLICDLELAETA